MQSMLEGVRKGVGKEVSLTWIDNAFLEKQGIKEGQFPLYEPPTGETAGFHRCNISRALKQGLKFRPVTETARGTLDWYNSLPPDVQQRVAPQFAKRPNEEAWLDTEKRLLQEWASRDAK